MLAVDLEYAYQLRAEAELARRGETQAPTWDQLLDESGVTEAELAQMPSELERSDG